MRLTAADIVSAIGNLPKDRMYHYINPDTKEIIVITEVRRPEGPVLIKRFNPDKGETVNSAKTVSISSEMIWRVANAVLPEAPLNLDRILGGSYNTRSALESLMAHTPQFYYCYPGRIERKASTETVRQGHKHIIWKPEKPHNPGVLAEAQTKVVVSEIPGKDIFYDAVEIPEGLSVEMDIDIKRRHVQIQVALIKIGQQLGFRTWVANNDRGIIYNEQRIGEMEGVVQSLNDEKLVQSFEDARGAALLIDCIWFKNGRLMPAVIEIEQSTGVTSGLSRMKNLQDHMPPFPTRYVIAAPDDDRDKVIKEISKPQFSSLQAKFFPYSAVEELYYLCERRKIRGVTEEFLDSFMETLTAPGKSLAN